MWVYVNGNGRQYKERILVSLVPMQALSTRPGSGVAKANHELLPLDVYMYRYHMHLQRLVWVTGHDLGSTSETICQLQHLPFVMQ